MNSLSIEQLKTIPWIKNYLSGNNIPQEPPLEDIHFLSNIPFKKRDRKYPLFYIWYWV